MFCCKKQKINEKIKLINKGNQTWTVNVEGC